jgi:hypothetical protein
MLSQLLDVNLDGVEQDAQGNYILGGGITDSSTNTLTNKTLDDYTNFIHADGIHLRVKATEPLSYGDVLKYVGFNNGQQAIEVAKRDDPTVPAIGILHNNLATGGFGLAVSNGLFKKLNTSAFPNGTILYPNATGGFTDTPSQVANAYNQPFAYVVRSHAVNGEIMLNIGAKSDKGDKGDVGEKGDKGDKGDPGTTTWAGITDKPEVFPPSAHTHAIADVTGLQTELDKKLDRTFVHGALPYAATVNLDMGALAGLYRTLTLTGNVTFTTSNRAVGRAVVVRLLSGASERTLNFPAGWVFLGAVPTTLAANKTAVLSVTFFGTADTDAVVDYGVYYRVETAPSFILDQISAPDAAAYSLRKLRTAYSGAAINVRRSSDGATQDIGFTASGNLDTVTLLAFVGTGNGFVTTWYDQSGNGRNATQTDSTRQPQIVNNGAIETQNGKPTIRQLTGAGFVASVPITGSTLTANAVASLDEQGVTGFKGLMSISNAGEFDYDSVSRGCLLLQVDAQASMAGFRTAYTSIVGITIGAQFVATNIFDGTNNTLWKDGSAGPTVASAGNFSTTLLSIGERLGPGVSSPWVGTFSEAILFTSDLSTTDRQTLEQNQGQFYSI